MIRAGKSLFKNSKKMCQYCQNEITPEMKLAKDFDWEYHPDRFEEILRKVVEIKSCPRARRYAANEIKETLKNYEDKEN